MIPPELLAMLRCPATGLALAPCPTDILFGVNDRIAGAAGTGLVNVGGQPVSGPVSDALLRADGGMLYLVKDNIPVLLAEEGISLLLS